MQLPSPENVLLQALAELKHDKWGFVIYRCTYQDDHAWERFKQNIHESTQKFTEMSDTPEAAKSLNDSLEWTFVEDRAALDDASRSQLRQRFKEWSAQAIVTEQPRAKAETERKPEPTFGIPRYNYFIQVDEEALQSVLAAPILDIYGEGVINFVDSRWKPLGDRPSRSVVEGIEDEDEVFDPIDGCTEENVGWMRFAASTAIDAEFYGSVFGFPGGGWYVSYKRPPETVMW
jgi:hypothetical protein